MVQFFWSRDETTYANIIGCSYPQYHGSET